MMRINNRYEVIEEIGRGGFGVVYKVEDLYEHHRFLALKKIKNEVISRKNVNVFKKEYEYLTTLKHPNLVSVYDFDIDRETNELFFTMEFIDGKSLYNAFREKITWSEIGDLIVQSSRALAFIHSKKIIHYDIKPDNIFIDKDGVLKLMDFGFAGNQDNIEKSKIRGTIQFLAPEMILKKTRSHRVDFFSLGVSFYYSITKRLPFTGSKKEDILRNAIKGKYRPLSEIVKNIPDDINKIVTKLMEKNPDDRFDHADQIIEEIKDVGMEDWNKKVYSRSEIRSYFSSGQLIERKKEMEFILKSVYKVLEGENYFDNRPLFLRGRPGIGKRAILDKFKNIIDIQEDVDYFRTYFVNNDSNKYQAFDIIIWEIIKRNNLKIQDYPVLVKYYAKKYRRTYNLSEPIFERLDDEVGLIVDFLLDFSVQNKIVLELRDIKNIQPPSLKFLDMLIMKIYKHPENEYKLFIIVNFEEDTLSPYIKTYISKLESYIRKYDVLPLDRGQSNTYIQEMLRIDNFSQDQTDMMMNFCKGIPFHINEFFINMFFKGYLELKHNKWFLNVDIALYKNMGLGDLIADNLNLLSSLERRILKCIALYNRPLDTRSFPFLANYLNISEKQLKTQIFLLCDKTYLLKLHYSDGFRYYINQSGLQNVILNTIKEEKKTHFFYKLVSFIEQSSLLEDKNIYELSDYYYKAGNRIVESQRHTRKEIITQAVNRSIEENNFELTIINLGRLYTTGKDLNKKANIFVGSLTVLYTLGRYTEIVDRITLFMSKTPSISFLNRININLILYNTSLKLGDQKSFLEASKVIYKSHKFKLISKSILAKIYLWTADYMFRNGKNKKGLKFAKVACKIFRSQKHFNQSAMTMILQAKIEGLNGRVQKAINNASNSIKIFNSYQDINQEIDAILVLGKIYMDHAYYSEALVYFQKALSLAETASNYEFIVQAHILLNYCNLFTELFQKVTANIEYITKSMKHIQVAYNRDLAMMLFVRYSYCKSDYQKALQYIDILEKEFNKAKDIYLFLEVLRIRISICLRLKFEDPLKRTVYMIEELIEKIEFKRIKGYCQFTLMNYYIYSGVKSSKVKKIYKKAYKNMDRNVTQKELLDMYYCEMQYHEYCQDREAAFEAVTSAFNIFNYNENVECSQFKKLDIEISYQVFRAYLGEHHQAISCLSHLLQKISSWKLYYYIYLINYHLGKIFLDLQQDYKAENCFELSLESLGNIALSDNLQKDISSYRDRLFMNK